MHSLHVLLTVAIGGGLVVGIQVQGGLNGQLHAINVGGQMHITAGIVHAIGQGQIEILGQTHAVGGRTIGEG